MTTGYRFGSFELQPDRRQLLADGRPVALGQRAFDVLHALVERRERLVGKNELLELAWPGVVVEENNLQVQISALRKVLGPQVIATIPGRGYRFTAALAGESENGPPATAPGAAAGPRESGKAGLNNLPNELPPLYGRDADLDALRALLDAHRLVTVVGAGGIGKSRLAQAVAHVQTGRWTDGAWMVELAGLSDPALLPNAVAQVLDVKFAGERAGIDELVAGLAPRTLLLVLDNCEHLLEAVATLVEAVLRNAPNVTVIATSQEPLRLQAEQQYRVVPLAVPPEVSARNAREYGAVALFEARVRAVDPAFALNDDNLALAIDICRRLDGLPLAIELAAARVATLGLRPVRDKLDARFRLLTGGARATLRRHQTLRAALEWSHNLLNDAERVVFRRVGVFAGGFTMELAQAMAAEGVLDEWAVLDVLSALVDKSLVVADPGDAPRYRLLESARAFALEQLAEGETADMLRRHAIAMRDFLKRVDDANLDGELRTDQYAAQVLPELDNLRAAYTWATGDAGDPQIAVALAAHAGSLIDYAVECAEWLLPLQPHVEDAAVEPGLAARYWRALAANNMSGRAPLPLQAEAASRACNLYRALGQPRRVFSSLVRLATYRQRMGDDDAARAALDEARAVIRPDWPTEFRLLLLRRDAFLARIAGRSSEALALYRAAVNVSVSTGDWRLQVSERNNLVDALWQLGTIEEAARMVCELAGELRTRPAAYSDMDVLFANLMGILAESGRIDEAVAAAREALPIMRRSGRLFFDEWAYLFWRRGQGATAARLLGASDAEQDRAGSPRQPNEERLVAEARAALEAELHSDTLAQCLAAGAELGKEDLFALVSEALARLPERRQ